jgi:hypothetical protein
MESDCSFLCSQKPTAKHAESKYGSMTIISGMMKMPRSTFKRSNHGNMAVYLAWGNATASSVDLRTLTD